MDLSKQMLQNDDRPWDYLPDTIILHIFNFLNHSELLKAGLTCRNWCRISYDEVLWKHLFYRYFNFDSNISIAPGKQHSNIFFQFFIFY